MTGDAILNLSKNDSNDSYKPSPTKTSSKLTPMTHCPHLPVFVERDKDYNRRVQLGKDMERRERERDKSESDTISPPLPPPPAPEEFREAVNDSNSHSERNKSDNLPPPPPPELVSASGGDKSNSLKNGHSGENGGADVCNNLSVNNGPKQFSGVNNYGNSNGNNRCPDHQLNSSNNNEDTSISSSVMSDSGDEIAEDEDVKRMAAGAEEANGTSQNRIVLKVEARKMNSTGSFDAERERDTEFAEVTAEKTSAPERERFESSFGFFLPSSALFSLHHLTFKAGLSINLTL